MTQQHAFFLARAADARRDAGAATLENVRERCLRAAAAWDMMAARAARTEKLRTKNQREKDGRLESWAAQGAEPRGEVS
jgi:hypothetical protein